MGQTPTNLSAAPGAMDGMSQGHEGMAQGHMGSVVGQTLGPQLGLTRTKGQVSGGPPPGGHPGLPDDLNPIATMIEKFLASILGGSQAPTPGGAAGQAPPPPGPGPGA